MHVRTRAARRARAAMIDAGWRARARAHTYICHGADAIDIIRYGRTDSE